MFWVAVTIYSMRLWFVVCCGMSCGSGMCLALNIMVRSMPSPFNGSQGFRHSVHYVIVSFACVLGLGWRYIGVSFTCLSIYFCVILSTCQRSTFRP